MANAWKAVAGKLSGSVAMLTAISLCGCSSTDQNSALADAKRYSTQPEQFHPQARFGTDWIETRQGRTDRTVAVEPGDPAQVDDYYEDVEKEVSRPLRSFNAIPEFFGYPGLTSKDLEDLEPATLMDPKSLAAAVPNATFQAAIKAVPLVQDDVLAARFFAPKITDVAVKPTDITHGWRKVVRLKARDKSGAKDNGLNEAWLLFNVFSNDPEPFKTRSLNNQVMLIRPLPTSTLKPVYWLVFGSTATGDGERIKSLNASFDNRAGGNKDYYLPTACAHCHGGLTKGQPDYAKAKLNYFDTDHWNDRTKDDFPNLPGKRGVLFDAGPPGDTEESQADFRAAFGVFAKLNTEVKAQNKIVDPTEQTFQSRAVNKWLDLHKTNTAFIDMFERNIAANSATQWTKANAIDAQVLPLLNRYCFRCHSSIAYHVFDKEAVLDRKESMVDRLNLSIENTFAMPQDRDLRQFGAKERECLLQLLPHLGENTSLLCPP
jgi:hypothetical protein